MFNCCSLAGDARQQDAGATSADGSGFVPLSLVYGVGGGSARRGHASASFFHEMLDYRAQVAGVLIDAELALGAGAFIENGVYVFHGAAAAEVVDDVIDEGEQLDGQIAHRN